VRCNSTDPARLPSTTTSYVPRRTSTPITLCVTLSVAGTLSFLSNRGHRPPSENIDDQQRGGESDRQSEGRRDHVE
jgi:hypothetical protein